MSDLSESQRLSGFHDSQPALAPPAEGFVHVDREGLHWLCQAVILSPAIEGYYLVRLTRMETGEPVGDPLVLGPSEYAAFARDRLLRPEDPRAGDCRTR